MNNKQLKGYNLTTSILVVSFLFSWICWCLLLESTEASLRHRMLSFCDNLNHHNLLLIGGLVRRQMCSNKYGLFTEDILIPIVHFVAYLCGILSLITVYLAYRISNAPSLTCKDKEDWISNKLGLRPPFAKMWEPDAYALIPYSPLELKREISQVEQQVGYEEEEELCTSHQKKNRDDQPRGKFKTDTVSTNECGVFQEYDLIDLPDFCLDKIQNECARARLQVYFDLFTRTKNASRFANEVYIMHAAGDIAGCNPVEFLARLIDTIPEKYASLLEREQQSHPHLYFG